MVIVTETLSLEKTKQELTYFTLSYSRDNLPGEYTSSSHFPPKHKTNRTETNISESNDHAGNTIEESQNSRNIPAPPAGMIVLWFPKV